MPYEVKLPNVTRGDVREIAIALVGMGPVVNGVVTRVPLSAADLALLQSTYTLIECQFKVPLESQDGAPVVDTRPALIDLSSARQELQFQASARLFDNTLGPAVVIKLGKTHTNIVRSGLVWDMQFSGPGVGPYTLLFGKGWSINQDQTVTTADTLPVTPPVTP